MSFFDKKECSIRRAEQLHRYFIFKISHVIHAGQSSDDSNIYT